MKAAAVFSADLANGTDGTPLEVSPLMEYMDIDREVTSDSVQSALRRLLLDSENDLESTPPQVIWATPDGREKLLV